MDYKQVDQLKILFIKQDNFEVGILPELGGSIAFAKYNNIDFMRPWTGELTPRRTCCYPLVPFSNRIDNGKFSFNGKLYQLDKNFGSHPHTIHGVAWQRPWQVLELNEAKVVLYYDHVPEIDKSNSWPFAFSVTQQIELSQNSLLMTMSIKNTDVQTIPVGFGWHPFFPRHDEVLLQFSAEHVVLNNQSMLPEKIVPLQDKWNYQTLRPLGEPNLDNCFVNWQGQAMIHWPNKKLSLVLTASKTLSHLVVMTPESPMNTFFAVEPVSHINNAINSLEPKKQGICFLAAGQTLSGWMRLHIME